MVRIRIAVQFRSRGMFSTRNRVSVRTTAVLGSGGMSLGLGIKLGLALALV